MTFLELFWEPPRSLAAASSEVWDNTSPWFQIAILLQLGACSTFFPGRYSTLKLISFSAERAVFRRDTAPSKWCKIQGKLDRCSTIFRRRTQLHKWNNFMVFNRFLTTFNFERCSSWTSDIKKIFAMLIWFWTESSPIQNLSYRRFVDLKDQKGEIKLLLTSDVRKSTLILDQQFVRAVTPV